MGTRKQLQELREAFRELLAELSIEEIATNFELMEQLKRTHQVLFINQK